MSYRKQISYLELQENGQRIRSAGYARLESLEKEEILTVQLKEQRIVSGKAVSLYLQRESGEQPLCEMTAQRGSAACEKRIPGQEDREPILGIRIPLERNLEIIGRFAGAAGTKKVSAPEPEREIEGRGQDRNQTVQANQSVQDQQEDVIQNSEMQQEWAQEKPRGAQEQNQREQELEQTVKTAETIVANGKTPIEKGEHDFRESRNGRDSGETGDLADGRETQPSKKTATENNLHMKDTKWEQLSSIYPHIHPFRDSREFLSVGPEDFVVLRERCYQMTHNSFLLHGYYNYRHLLLMRQEISGEVKYYIGVPGNFYEREKQVARMFGFESFEGTREPAWEGDFGYYLISVEL